MNRIHLDQPEDMLCNATWYRVYRRMETTTELNEVLIRIVLLHYIAVVIGSKSNRTMNGTIDALLVYLYFSC